MVTGDKAGSTGDKGHAREIEKIKKIPLIAGMILGSGVTLILDKLWWKYMAMRLDNPLDHYSLGILLIVAGILIYKLAIPRYSDDRG